MADGALLTFFFPFALFIIIAAALYLEFTRPHAVPGLAAANPSPRPAGPGRRAERRVPLGGRQHQFRRARGRDCTQSRRTGRQPLRDVGCAFGPGRASRVCRPRRGRWRPGWPELRAREGSPHQPASWHWPSSRCGSTWYWPMCWLMATPRAKCRSASGYRSRKNSAQPSAFRHSGSAYSSPSDSVSASDAAASSASSESGQSRSREAARSPAPSCGRVPPGPCLSGAISMVRKGNRPRHRASTRA